MKRVMDILISLLALMMLFPVMAVLALLVRLKLGKPIFFVQERIGKKGAIFRIFKFRTMKAMVDPNGEPIPDAERLTRFGNFLRHTSLDELPELVNVLRGEMSLVGPRPLLIEYRDRYSERHFRRHDVLPGITGWAQVNGRNAISWSEKFELDLYYVENWSLWFDIRILYITVGKVISRSSINQEGHATVSKFNGYD